GPARRRAPRAPDSGWSATWNREPRRWRRAGRAPAGQARPGRGRSPQGNQNSPEPTLRTGLLSLTHLQLLRLELGLGALGLLALDVALRVARGRREHRAAQEGQVLHEVL